MEKIRAWRRERKISIEAAGELVGVSGVQWSRYETGKRRIPAENLQAISEVTGIPPHELRPDLAGLIGQPGAAA
ncbi:helix-turn-helix domain-containing protein [Ensifer sp. OTU672]|uniref:helix-turn-helix domain-containing protein n=1 Tax=Ensifer sp. OTU672 TaxID=3043861 RepID=UPI00406BFF4A